MRASTAGWIAPLALSVFLGCGAGGTDEPPPEEEMAQPEAGGLVLADPVHHLDGLAREPMLVQHPGGALFLAGYGSQVTGTDPRAVPRLWRSDDGGAGWSRVEVGSAQEGAIGNSDVDLAVGPSGALFFASMGFDRSTFEGTHVAIGVSHDIGANWSWTLLSETRLDDRPWVAVAPEGTAHVVWNDDSGVAHAVSKDGGHTWEERQRIHPEGGSSHLAVGPNGELAVRITPIAASANVFAQGVDLVAVSRDGGESWEKHPAPGERDWDPTFRDPTKVPRWVEPLAWGAGGALYHLWSAGSEVRLARSTDQGQSWTEWAIAEAESVAFFPFLTASDEGNLAATWFTGSGDEMAANVALIEVPEGEGQPGVLRSEAFQPDSWRESEGERVRDPGGEYLPVVFLADGDLGVAAPIQDLHGDRFGFSWWRVTRE
jgi:photosystem II stability/assembly factor-like uncharacterized protein